MRKFEPYIIVFIYSIFASYLIYLKHTEALVKDDLLLFLGISITIFILGFLGFFGVQLHYAIAGMTMMISSLLFVALITFIN